MQAVPCFPFSPPFEIVCPQLLSVWERFSVYSYFIAPPFEHRFSRTLRNALSVSRSLPFCNRLTRTLPAQECFSSFILTFQTPPLNTVFPARSAMCPPFSVLRPPKSPSRREPPLRLIYPPLFKAFPVFSVHVVPRFSHFNSSKSLRPVKFSHASPFYFLRKQSAALIEILFKNHIKSLDCSVLFRYTKYKK